MYYTYCWSITHKKGQHYTLVCNFSKWTDILEYQNMGFFTVLCHTMLN